MRLDNVERHGYEVQKLSMAGGTAQGQGLFPCVRLDNVERHGCDIQKLNMASAMLT